jgi:general secretion pathway protein G
VRRRFIVEGFQTAFLLTLVVWVAGWLVVLATGVLAPAIWPLLAGRPQDTDPALASALLILHDSLWLPLAIFFLGLTIVLIRETHRVAGPLYRFRQVFRTIASGDLSLRVRVRDGDYLTQEADELDRMVAALRDRVSHMQNSLHRVVTAVEALDREGLLPRENTHALRESISNARAEAHAFRTTTPPSNDGRVDAPIHRDAGFSLVELLLVVIIITTITAIGVPALTTALDRARITKAIGDINAIGKDITMFQVSRGCWPASLADVGHAFRKDPWKQTYVYQVARKPGGSPSTSCQACGGSCVSPGQARKDKNLVPINNDFDLFSMGKDRQTSVALTARASQDDIIRGRSGGFIGLASEY